MTLHVEQIKLTDLPVAELREPDRIECEAAGYTPQQALNLSVRLSAKAYRVVYDGQTLGYWGHAPVSVLGHAGVVWCLSAPAADEYPTIFGLHSWGCLNHLLTIYDQLFVQVDLNYKRSLHWLRRMGFMEISRSGRFATMRKAR